MLAPTGTVTLVFTDLRASAGLWSDDATTMREALTLHDKIMRETLRRFAGYEVKSEGGSFMLAFQEATAAIQFACAVQMRLIVADWSKELLAHDVASEVRSAKGRLIFAGLRISIGIHCGNPDCRIDPTTGRMDYFGPVANRAARVNAAAHEGQILISKTVKEACPDFDEAKLNDLGPHRLRGLEGAIHLFEAQASRLTDRRFPPPLTLDAIRTNLDVRGDHFIGRSDLLKRVAQVFEQGHRLLTLMGASGLGKTRLAQRFGGLHLEDFPGGVWFCDLAEASSLADVISCVGRALSMPLTTGRTDAELLAQVGASLQAKGRALLIVDNLEQVIEPSAKAVDHWTNAADELCILTTSQERLRLSAETTLEVGPLSENEAMELFEVRARGIRGVYQPSLQERQAIADVVLALDYIPLAIELAAAQVNRMSALTLSQQLKERLDLLSAANSDRPKRHRTLRAAIEWSWALLDPPEQAALAQASVFRGGFTLEAAEDIIVIDDDEAPWTMDLLEALSDKSFLNVQGSNNDEGELRFTIFESIRIFAAEALGNEEGSAASSARHASYYGNEAMRLVDGIYGQDGIQIRQQLSQEHQNLQAVVNLPTASPEERGRCVLAQTALLKVAGPLRARGPLLDLVDDHLGAMSPALRAKLLRAKAEHQADRGDIQDAITTLREALKAARTSDEEQLQGRVLGTLGLLLRTRGETQAARDAYEQALACARRCGDDPTRGAMLNNLAALEHDQARFSAAEDLFLEALELAIARHQAHGAAIAQMNLGTISAERGHLRRAKHYYQQALERFEAHGAHTHETTLIALLGMIELDEGQLSSAKKKLGQSLQRAMASGHTEAQIMSEVWHGVAHWLDDESDAAFLRLRSAVGAMGQLSNPKTLAFAHAYYGAVLTWRNRAAEAREEFRLARYLMRESGNRNHLDALKILVGVASVALAKQALENGDNEAYARHLHLARQRHNYANQAQPPNDAFPEGLPAPVKRSADARLCFKLLQRGLDQLPGANDPLDITQDSEKDDDDEALPLNPWEGT